MIDRVSFPENLLSDSHQIDAAGSDSTQYCRRRDVTQSFQSRVLWVFDLNIRASFHRLFALVK